MESIGGESTRHDGAGTGGAVSEGPVEGLQTADAGENNGCTRACIQGRRKKGKSEGSDEREEGQLAGRDRGIFEEDGRVGGRDCECVAPEVDVASVRGEVRERTEED